MAAATALFHPAEGASLSSGPDGTQPRGAASSTDAVVGRAVAAAAALVCGGSGAAGRPGVVRGCVGRGAVSAGSTGTTLSTDHGIGDAVEAADELVARHAAALEAAGDARAQQKKQWLRLRQQQLSPAEREAARVANRDRLRKKRARESASSSLEEAVE